MNKVSKRKASQFDSEVARLHASKEKQAKTESPTLSTAPRSAPPSPATAPLTGGDDTETEEALLTPPQLSQAAESAIALPSMAALTLAPTLSAPSSPLSSVRARESAVTEAEERTSKRSRGRQVTSSISIVRSVERSVNDTSTDGPASSILAASPSHSSTAASLDSACLQMRQISLSVTAQSQSLSPITATVSLSEVNEEKEDSRPNVSGVRRAHSTDLTAAQSQTLKKHKRNALGSPPLPPTGSLNDNNEDHSDEELHSIATGIDSLSTDISSATDSTALSLSRSSPTSLRCDVCAKELSGVSQMAAHLLGRKHAHAVLMTASGGEFRCNLCSKIFTCAMDRDKHFTSEKHKKIEKILQQQQNCEGSEEGNVLTVATSVSANDSTDTATTSSESRKQRRHRAPQPSSAAMSAACSPSSSTEKEIISIINSAISASSSASVSKKRKFGRSSPAIPQSSSSSSLPSLVSPASTATKSTHSIRYLTAVEACSDPSLMPVNVRRQSSRYSDGEHSSTNSPIVGRPFNTHARLSLGSDRSRESTPTPSLSVERQSILRSPERAPELYPIPYHPSSSPLPMPMPPSHSQAASMYAGAALPFTMQSSSTPLLAFLSPAALAALNGPVMPSLTPVTVLFPTEMVHSQSQSMNPFMMSMPPYHYAPPPPPHPMAYSPHYPYQSPEYDSASLYEDDSNEIVEDADADAEPISSVHVDVAKEAPP